MNVLELVITLVQLLGPSASTATSFFFIDETTGISSGNYVEAWCIQYVQTLH
jgi:hypothetical protein